MKYRIDTLFPTRDLTTNERDFLSGLSAYSMDLREFFRKSVSFCIDNLQTYTELVLSGFNATRPDYSSRKELEKEIEEMEELIKKLEGKRERGELLQEEWALLEKFKGQLGRLKEALLKEEYKTSRTTRLLGLYEHNGGHDSRVTLYVNNIEHAAKHDPQKTMYLMGQVLLHEYFHSFYYHTNGGTNPSLKCAEEPMAELGSLVVLNSVATSGLMIAPWAKNALPYAKSFVKKKQKCNGITAAYGFGAYLYGYPSIYVLRLISLYARVSRLIDAHSVAALEYKYMVYPEYPSSPLLEKLAYKKLIDLLVPYDVSRVARTTSAKKFPIPPAPTPVSPTAKWKVVVRKTKCKEFAFEVFEYLESKGLLKQLGLYITTKRTAHLVALVESGVFNMSAVFLDYSLATSTPGYTYYSNRWFDHDFVINKKYRLSKDWMDSGKDPDPHLQIYKLVSMLYYVYPGKFKYRKDVDEFILESVL